MIVPLTMSVTSLLTALTALGAAVTGGVLFGFSAFIMRGLDATSPQTAVTAMKEINRAAVRAPFMIPMFGTALLCIVLAVPAIQTLRGGEDEAWLVLAGGGFYLASLAITMAYHVPRNDALQEVEPGGTQVVAAWAEYVRDWVRWNHIRTAGSLSGAVCLMLALMR